MIFDSWVDSGTIEGNGPGNSANNRLNSFRSMLERAGDLINSGDTEKGCKELKLVYDKCDLDSPPPDFVTGESVPELSEMILELIENLGCE